MAAPPDKVVVVVGRLINPVQDHQLFLLVKPMNKKNNLAVKTIEGILVAGFIIFEELIWNVLAKPIIDRLNRLAIFAKLRLFFLEMNRYLLMIIFVLIFALTEYLGILSGITVVSGHVSSGVTIYLLKAPLAAFTFWLFELTKPKLMTFAWLESTYNYLMRWKDLLTGTDVYQSLKTSISATRSRMKQAYRSFTGDQSLLGSIKTHYTLVKTFFMRPQ